MPSKKTAASRPAPKKGEKKKQNKEIAKKPASSKEKKSPSLPLPVRAETPVEVQGRNKGAKTPALLRGVKDILPKDGKTWKRMFRGAEGIAEAYGYERIETPTIEEASLFVRSIGKETDVIEKEMYIFDDRDGTKVALRPEWTAGVARAYITHGMHTLPQPVKVWCWGPLFRHDRPQAGRYREFHQFDCEVIGVHEPVADAELISVAYNYIRDLGINSMVRMNSIGTPEDRVRYVIELTGYLRSKRSHLSELSKKRLIKNPLRVLDSKEPEDQAILEDAPQIIDWLSEDSKKFFMGVLEYLDELQIPYVLDSKLVRGLDYYTDTVFEIYEESEEKGSQNALGGGGRYNGLIAALGGLPTPASGFALGIERIAQSLKKKESAGGEAPAAQKGPVPVFFAHLGEQARRRTLVLIEQLRRSGVLVRHSLGKPSLKAQLELANKIGSTHAIILGQKEVLDATVIIRDMDSGIQEIVDQNKLEKEIRRFSK